MTDPPLAIIAAPRAHLMRPLVALLPISVAGHALGLSFLPWTTDAVALMLVLRIAWHGRDRLTVGPAGVEVRWFWRRRRISWDSILTLTERTTLFGRSVVWRDGRGRAKTLPALIGPAGKSATFDEMVSVVSRTLVAAGQPPIVRLDRRSGWRTRTGPVLASVLCLAALAGDKPWFWAPRAEAMTVPDACDVLARALPTGVLTTTASSQPRFAQCAWSADGQEALLTFGSNVRAGLTSGTGVAAARFAAIASDARAAASRRSALTDRAGLQDSPFVYELDPPRGAIYRVTDVDVGDEAILITTDLGFHILARRANVVVIAFCDCHHRLVMAEPEAVELARQAVDALVLS